MSLVITDLQKSFGEVRALDGISFSVDPGQVFGFLGANGAGKTTAMRIVLDILRADAGTVTWKGRPSTELPRRTFGYLPEERGLYPRMKVLDQLVFFAGLYGVPRKEAEKEVRAWLARFRVPEYADRRAEQLSKGYRQRVSMALVLLHDPSVLIMDEPTSGLDPNQIQGVRKLIRELGRSKTILVSTHILQEVEPVADRVLFIHDGRLVFDGTPQEFASDNRSMEKRFQELTAQPA
jgi:ABC-2 type transport system ATP-binding protein